MDQTSARVLSDLSAICPIGAVRVGDPSDVSTWSFTPQASATAAQIAAANAALAAYIAPLPIPAPAADPMISAVLNALMRAGALTQAQANAGIAASKPAPSATPVIKLLA